MTSPNTNIKLPKDRFSFRHAGKKLVDIVWDSVYEEPIKFAYFMMFVTMLKVSSFPISHEIERRQFCSQATPFAAAGVTGFLADICTDTYCPGVFALPVGGRLYVMVSEGRFQMAKGGGREGPVTDETPMVMKMDIEDLATGRTCKGASFSTTMGELRSVAATRKDLRRKTSLEGASPGR